MDHNDYVINKNSTLTEHAFDIVRYSHSSFKIKEFTPNPAGQMGNGFYSVNIIPMEQTHLKKFELSGISRPISVSNNWLAPQVDGFYVPGIQYLNFIYSNDIYNKIAQAVISALRLCRQSFYSIGAESQFLNLALTLDGLTNPAGNGWKHRTFIAALLSKGSTNVFEIKLEKYDSLYTDVRNKPVHKEKNFYELNVGLDDCCDEMFTYIKDVIVSIADKVFNHRCEMETYAVALLREAAYVAIFTAVINRVSKARGKIQMHLRGKWLIRHLSLIKTFGYAPLHSITHNFSPLNSALNHQSTQ